MELTISKLSKHYKGKIAVDQFEATMTDGVYALLGANGAGKTTLMRMLCDILKPTSGEVLVDGTNISVLGESYRELLGYLPQDFGYYPNFTGWDFMMYLSALKGLPKITAVKRCEELLELVGLYDVRAKKIKTYSGGMRQRIGIAQSLINSPKFLVLDEPTAGLDPKERTKFRNIISNLSKGRIILLSTHIVSDVDYIADHVFIMKDGRCALRDKADTVCSVIENAVWTCVVSPKAADEISSKYVVSNFQHQCGEVEMRVVSKEKPCDNAVSVVPNLEDLYLHFIGKG